MAALRERRDEVVPLAEHFLREFAERFGKDFDTIAPEAQDTLRNAPWPGNVRELRNTVERIVLMEDGPVLRAEHVSSLLAAGAGDGGPALVTPAEAPLPPEGLDLDQTMLRIIERALEMHNGNQSRAARYLHITREALRYRMQKVTHRLVLSLSDRSIRYLSTSTYAHPLLPPLDRHGLCTSPSGGRRRSEGLRHLFIGVGGEGRGRSVVRDGNSSDAESRPPG